MSKLSLSSDAIAMAIETLKADKAVAKRWVACSDTLRAEGVTSELMLSDKEWRNGFMASVVMLSFTKTEQAIYATPMGNLSEEQKVTKRFVTTERGARYAKVVRHLSKAERDAEMSDDEREAQARKTIGQKLKADLERWIDKIEKAEAVDFSATQMLEALKSAKALIKN